MMLDLSRHIPPGLNLKPERTAYSVGMLLSVLFSLLYFFPRYSDQLIRLYRWNGLQPAPLPGAVMPDFAGILGQALIGFPVLSAMTAGFAALHYLYHYQESKSIYTMRRLTNRRELHRRCLTLPLLGFVLSVLTAFLLLLVFFAVYMIRTPKICLTPGQWRKLWSVTR